MRSSLLVALMSLVFAWPLMADDKPVVDQKLDALEKQLRALGFSEDEIKEQVEKARKKNEPKTPDLSKKLADLEKQLRALGFSEDEIKEQVEKARKKKTEETTNVDEEKHEQIIKFSNALNRLFSLQLILEKSNRYDLVYHSLVNGVLYENIPEELVPEYKKILALCKEGELHMSEIGISEKYLGANKNIMYGEAVTVSAYRLIKSDITGAIITGFDVLKQTNALDESFEKRVEETRIKFAHKLKENMHNLRILAGKLTAKLNIPEGYIILPKDLEKLSALNEVPAQPRFGELEVLSKRYPRLSLIELYKVRILVLEKPELIEKIDWKQTEIFIRRNANRTYPIDPVLTEFHALALEHLNNVDDMKDVGWAKEIAIRSETLNYTDKYIEILKLAVNTTRGNFDEKLLASYKKMMPSDEKDEEALLIWATSLLHAIGGSSGSEFINSSTYEALSALFKSSNYDQVQSIFRKMDALYEYDKSRKQFIRDKLTISVSMSVSAKDKGLLWTDWYGSVNFKNWGREALSDIYIITVSDKTLKLDKTWDSYTFVPDDGKEISATFDSIKKLNGIPKSLFEQRDNYLWGTLFHYGNTPFHLFASSQNVAKNHIGRYQGFAKNKTTRGHFIYLPKLDPGKSKVVYFDGWGADSVETTELRLFDPDLSKMDMVPLDYKPSLNTVYFFCKESGGRPIKLNQIKKTDSQKQWNRKITNQDFFQKDFSEIQNN